MAEEEQSAGVVVYRSAAQEAAPRNYLLLDYGSHWDFPKGHIEAGETPRAAALREVAEETGIGGGDLAFADNFAEQITYFFRDRKKRLVRKTVIFFLAATTVEQITLSDEHVGFEFLPFELALRRLTFPSARQVLRRAEEVLAGASSQPGESTKTVGAASFIEGGSSPRIEAAPLGADAAPRDADDSAGA